MRWFFVWGLNWIVLKAALAHAHPLAFKLWAVLSGFGWAAGTVAMKYFQRDRDFDS